MDALVEKPGVQALAGIEQGLCLIVAGAYRRNNRRLKAVRVD